MLLLLGTIMKELTLDVGFMLQYPVYFAFEDDDVVAVLADIKKNDISGQPATATTGGWVSLFRYILGLFISI